MSGKKNSSQERKFKWTKQIQAGGKKFETGKKNLSLAKIIESAKKIQIGKNKFE